MKIIVLASILITYKKVTSDFRASDQLCVGLGLFRWDRGIIVGYARQLRPLSEGSSSKDEGIMLQLCDDFDRVSIKLSAIYWFDQLQYSMTIMRRIFRDSFSIGVTYEKIIDWDELDLSLAYLF